MRRGNRTNKFRKVDEWGINKQYVMNYVFGCASEKLLLICSCSVINSDCAKEILSIIIEALKQ